MPTFNRAIYGLDQRSLLPLLSGYGWGVWIGQIDRVAHREWLKDHLWLVKLILLLRECALSACWLTCICDVLETINSGTWIVQLRLVSARRGSCNNLPTGTYRNLTYLLARDLLWLWTRGLLGTLEHLRAYFASRQCSCVRRLQSSLSCSLTYSSSVGSGRSLDCHSTICSLVVRGRNCCNWRCRCNFGPSALQVLIQIGGGAGPILPWLLVVHHQSRLWRFFILVQIGSGSNWQRLSSIGLESIWDGTKCSRLLCVDEFGLKFVNTWACRCYPKLVVMLRVIIVVHRDSWWRKNWGWSN